jgi:hypothetical protein
MQLCSARRIGVSNLATPARLIVRAGPSSGFTAVLAPVAVSLEVEVQVQNAPVVQERGLALV